jgi:hypothetical protein
MFLAKATVGGVTAKGRSPRTNLSESSPQRYRARAARAAAIARPAAVLERSKLAGKADDARNELMVVRLAVDPGRKETPTLALGLAKRPGRGFLNHPRTFSSAGLCGLSRYLFVCEAHVSFEEGKRLLRGHSIRLAFAFASFNVNPQEILFGINKSKRLLKGER